MTYATNVRELRDPKVLPKELRQIADPLPAGEVKDIIQHAADELERMQRDEVREPRTAAGSLD